MTPTRLAAPPPEEAAEKETSNKTTGALTPQSQAVQPEIEQGAVAARGPSAPGRAGESKAYDAGQRLFAEALLETSSTRPGQRTLDFLLSVVFHTIFLGTLILIPLYFTEAIDLRQFTQTFLVAPPPPPPPPPPASPAIVKTSPPRRVFTSAGKLMAPTVIPEKIAMLREETLPPEVAGGIMGGVPGGVPGGQVGGVIGGIISGASRTYIPAAPAAAPKAPIRVGGRVRAPRAISAPDPLYPPLAKQAKIQGDVLIDAEIDVSGKVVEMKVLSGHPLLIPAALDALRKWKYEPTYLNDEPVAVQLVVTVKFRLGM